MDVEMTLEVQSCPLVLSRTSSIPHKRKRATSEPERVQFYTSSGWTSVNKPAVSTDNDRQKSPLSDEHLITERLKENENFFFTEEEHKAIILWMKRNGAKGAETHQQAFEQLLTDLGFKDHSLHDDTMKVLRRKVQVKMNGLTRDMKNYMAMNVSQDERSVTKVSFAEWTDGWYNEDWDGSLRPPELYTVQGLNDVFFSGIEGNDGQEHFAVESVEEDDIGEDNGEDRSENDEGNSEEKNGEGGAGGSGEESGEESGDESEEECEDTTRDDIHDHIGCNIENITEEDVGYEGGDEIW